MGKLEAGKLDYLGNEIKENDVVIFMNPNYKKFMTGLVIKCSPKKATIYFKERYFGAKNTTRSYNQLIKLNKITGEKGLN